MTVRYVVLPAPASKRTRVVVLGNQP